MWLAITTIRACLRYSRIVSLFLAVTTPTWVSYLHWKIERLREESPFKKKSAFFMYKKISSPIHRNRSPSMPAALSVLMMQAVGIYVEFCGSGRWMRWVWIWLWFNIDIKPPFLSDVSCISSSVRIDKWEYLINLESRVAPRCLSSSLSILSAWRVSGCMDWLGLYKAGVVRSCNKAFSASKDSDRFFSQLTFWRHLVHFLVLERL